ncbi:phosphatidylinositol N-acetylglucosaminyltransferase subunit P-like [Macadamia integrifolia]|uniref:phosphatidylinositol N-acetylglucosaminyltransferase subunit P-like n=1 Tax=Macadamia integrifolia TaxID=60698 RepID=UPI001C4FB9C1|nr:phosphatidylinositol N-acetylglucosaminyltransferase subunit P-like [Macadamia integrifolia]XP_042499520.1 phosphatidylinositol N-acetylglucosaminyltransferase subunit P-like [Macadamia integrifolia]XP_042499528.1 phosphatidylinositol N-acetylglucosaminyltransferase subunit P-like [Macadamia integrifolia]
MADSYSVNSPRRTLSLSKRATVSFTDPEDKVPGFAVSEEHGPKPSEVYGFVGSITTVVATVIFLGWAYVPEPWLHSIGITYYPSRYWALAVPVYAMVTVVLAMVLYLGLNFMATTPPTSLNTIFDEYSRSRSSFMPYVTEDERPIEPIFDLDISQVNDLMFNSAN